MNNNETFSRETREKIYKKAGFACVRCGERNYLSIHHIVSNTKMNRKIYGNKRIQDISNSALVCQKCHNNHMFWDKEIKKNLIKKWDEENKKR